MDLNRRNAILGLTATAGLTAAGAAAAAPYPWAARHGLTAQQYQTAFNQMSQQGFRLVHIDGYAVAGIPRFAAIWAKTGGGAWVARHNLTGAQYQTQFNQMSQQGYRLTKVSGYQGGNQALYAALWERKQGPEWRARHGMTAAQYQQTFSNLGGQGFELTHVDGYVINGQPFFAAIWERTGNGNYMARHGLSSGAYQQAFDQAAQDGWRLRQVSGYSGGAPAQFAAIWDKRSTGAWVARHDMTSAGYQQTFDQQVAQGYRPIDVSGYDQGGQATYAAIFVRD